MSSGYEDRQCEFNSDNAIKDKIEGHDKALSKHVAYIKMNADNFKREWESFMRLPDVRTYETIQELRDYARRMMRNAFDLEDHMRFIFNKLDYDNLLVNK